MLKIKDNVNLKELQDKYNLAYDNDGDYEGGWSYETLDKDGVFIDLWDRKINGIDNSSLILLYDLIKADLVEKVGEIDNDRLTAKDVLTGLKMIKEDEEWFLTNEARIILLDYIEQLQSNWNNLREYIGKEWYSFDNESIEFKVAKNILDKMNELERSDKE